MAQKIKLPEMHITYKNFGGTRFAGGKRDFAIILENPEDIQQLINFGFNVKMFNKKNPEDPDSYYLKVKVNFKNDEEGKLLGPYIYIVNGDHISKPLKASNVELIDKADIDYCDIYITPYRSVVNGTEFISAYLDTMYVNVRKDEFEEKYKMYQRDIDEDNMVEDEIPFE